MLELARPRARFLILPFRSLAAEIQVFKVDGYARRYDARLHGSIQAYVMQLSIDKNTKRLVKAAIRKMRREK